MFSFFKRKKKDESSSSSSGKKPPTAHRTAEESKKDALKKKDDDEQIAKVARRSSLAMKQALKKEPNIEASIAEAKAEEESKRVKNSRRISASHFGTLSYNDYLKKQKEEAAAKEKDGNPA